MKGPKLNEDEWGMAFVMMSIFLLPAIIGGFIGGCMANSDTNLQHDKLQDYVADVSNRIDRIEYALDRFVIPVQPKEVSHE